MTEELKCDKKIPKITISSATEIFEIELCQWNALSSLALLDALPADLASGVSGIRVSSANLITFTLGKRSVVWGSGEDSGRKVAILTALLRTPAKVIDVSAPDTPVTR